MEEGEAVCGEIEKTVLGGKPSFITGRLPVSRPNDGVVTAISTRGLPQLFNHPCQ